MGEGRFHGRAGSDRDVPKRFAGDRAAGHSLASAQVGFERSDGGGRQDALVACSTVGLQRVERAQLVPQFHQLEKRNAARHLEKAQLRRAEEQAVAHANEGAAGQRVGAHMARGGSDGGCGALTGY